MIVLTTMNDGKKACEMGASDYLTKPIDLARLADSVKRFVHSET
jgi:DNA-binding response OmpR family regulator